MDITTITLSVDVKRKLEKLKRYNRESFNEVISRMISMKDDKDNSISETIDILSNPDIMRSLAKSLEDLKRGKTYSIDEV